MDLAARFRKLRVDAGLTGTALAVPRYTVSYISQIEAGRRRPSPEALEFFAGRLGVTPAYLLTGVPEGLEVSLRYRLEEAKRQLRTGIPAEAEGSLRTLVAEAKQFSLPRLAASAVSVLGTCLASQGRVREAIDAYEEALAGELPRTERGTTVARLGSAYRTAGDLTYAAELLEAYLATSNGEPLDPRVATDLHSILVSIYFERGDVLRAERAARRALGAADEHTPADVRAIAYWNAARVLAEGKLWDEALDLATRARVLMEELEDRRNVARLHNAYAFICLDTDPPRTAEARTHLDAAELLFQTVAAKGDLAYLYAERARLALLEGQAEEALEHADRALADASTEQLETARGLFLKGRALSMLGRFDEGREVLKEAAAAFGRHGARQQEASCWREIGEIHLNAGELQPAIEALKAGLEALDPRRSRA
jgi:tetratricopeptide (TPR) repeat protein